MVEVPSDRFDEVGSQFNVMVKGEEHRPPVAHHFGTGCVHPRVLHLSELVAKLEHDGLLILMLPLISLQELLLPGFKQLRIELLNLGLDLSIDGGNKSVAEVLPI